MDESFILLNLKDEKSKKLAQVISNSTSRKILELLTKKEATQSEIAKELGVGLSTIDYNLKHLKDAGLVIVDEFHYSEKGKEVNHYKLANKFVIIAPQESKLEQLKSQLSKIIPAVLGIGLGTWIVNSNTIAAPGVTQMQAIPMAAKVATIAADDVQEESIAQLSQPVIEETAQTFALTEPAQWFLIGAVTILAVYIVVEIIRAYLKSGRNKS